MIWFKVPLGGQKWRVDLVKGNHREFEGDRCHGITLNEKCRVLIAREFEESVRESTSLHELFGHAAFYVSGAHQELLDACDGDEEKANKVEEDMIRKLELVWFPMMQFFGWKFPKVPA